MSDMDQGLKRIIQAFPEAVISAILPDARVVQAEETDVAMEPQRVLDTLYRVLVRQLLCVVDIEGQARYSPDVPARCHQYAIRAMTLSNLPCVSIVILLKRHGRPKATHIIRLGELELGHWNIWYIEVYNMDAAKVIAEGNLAWLPLVPFMRGGTRERIELAGRVVQERAPADRVATLETLLAVFTAEFFGNEVALDFLRRTLMSTDILEESPLYREWIQRATEQGIAKGLEQGQAEGIAKGLEQGQAEGIAKGLEQGQAEGIAKGLEQGLEQGQVAGMRQALRLVLAGRFGALAGDVLAAIDGADVARLTDVATHMATEPLEQVRARLGLA